MPPKNTPNCSVLRSQTQAVGCTQRTKINIKGQSEQDEAITATAPARFKRSVVRMHRLQYHSRKPEDDLSIDEPASQPVIDPVETLKPQTLLENQRTRFEGARTRRQISKCLRMLIHLSKP